MGEIEYEKLRLDVLQKLIEERGIECKSNKTEIIKYLIMDDDGKYIRETTYEKYGKDMFLCGIDIKNQKHIMDMSKLIEKKEAKRFDMYSNNRIHFLTKQKLM